LARYSMLITLATTTALRVSPALAQESAPAPTANSLKAIDVPAPTPKAAATFHRPIPKQNWLTSSASDLTLLSSRLVDDQKQFWTSPRHLRYSDAEWLIPLAAITAGMTLTDPNFSKSLPNTPGTLSTFQHVRNGSVISLGAASGGLYLWSLHSHDPHQRETGLLAGEAVLDALVVSEGLKFIAGRQRPLQANGQGNFFQGGSSFPSTHAAAAWAAAGVLAHEYHGPMTKLLVYGLATTVSVASVGSKQHFPSDVLVGSALGWMVSEYVYRAHHDPELGGSSWPGLSSMLKANESGPAQFPGSVYVPVDSWVYDAFDRLAALGFLSSAMQGKRPWSRQECTRLLAEVDEALASRAGSNPIIRAQANSLVESLHHEFAREENVYATGNTSAQLDSLYARTLSASGTVLNDGYHFGQTYAYDFGRPFREGTNVISGATASATYGSLFFYLGGEFQHSPSEPALSTPVRNFISTADKTQPPPATPFAPINQFQLLDAYAGINLHGWLISFGNQSLSWGPGLGGSLLLSDNAAPIPMLRITQQSAADIPGLSRVLGPFSFDQFYGRVEGHKGGSDQPWLYGQKISFKPLRSLEFAYSRTTLIGGAGHPLTSSLFFESLFGRVNAAENSVPGDSRTAIDWTWRLLKLRDWATFYGELEDDDDLIPLQNVAKSVIRPGIYFPHLPFLPRWDLHFEYTSSTSPGRASFQNHGHLNYWNLDYTDGYTNNGNLLSNTVGREGITLQTWLRYWISPRHTLDFSWKQNRVLNDFVPGGGKWQDFQTSYSVTRPSGLYCKGFFQFEHISSFPLLFPSSRNNVTAALELGFLPQWGRHSSTTNSARAAQSNQSIGSSMR